MRHQADVVVPVYRDVAITRECIESVLEHSGAALARLILVDDRGPEPEMAELLETFRAGDRRVRLLVNETNLGFVRSANRGMAVRERDVCLLNSDTRVTLGWLDECLEVLHDDEANVAAVSPLSNNATFCSVPVFGRGVAPSVLDGGLDLSQLPRYTDMPTGQGFCLVLKDEALRMVGLFDPVYGRGYHEENDWCQRARAAGFVIRRANRALVFHHGEVSFAGERAVRDVLNGRRLIRRYPRFLAETAHWEASDSARVAARLIQAMLDRRGPSRGR